MKTSKVSSKVRLSIAITLAAVSVITLACGSSQPSESAGRKYLDATHERSGTAKAWKVKSFTKTNGTGDDKSYTMEYEAELVCHTVVDGTKCDIVGKVIQDKDKILFQKTDNGWRAPDGNIY